MQRRITARNIASDHPVGKVGADQVQLYVQDGKLYGQSSSDSPVLVADLSVGSVPVGTVNAFAGATAPAGWLLANGSSKSQTEYAALYALILHTYGSDPGGGNFILPDLRGKVVAAEDGTYSRGDSAGAVTATIASANLPNHNHTVSGTQNASITHTMESGVQKVFTAPSPNTVSDEVDDGFLTFWPLETTGEPTMRTRSAEDAFAFTTSVDFSNATVSGGGSGTPTGLENRQPTLYMNYIIKH